MAALVSCDFWHLSLFIFPPEQTSADWRTNENGRSTSPEHAHIQFEPRISCGKFKNKYFLVVIGMTMSLKGISIYIYKADHVCT